MTKTNLEEVLEKFENGERRYAEDPNFKSAVDSLNMGIGVYAVLDHELKEAFKRRQAVDALIVKVEELQGLVVGEVSLKKIVYLTGPQGSGKTTLVNQTPKALELNAVKLVVENDLKHALALAGVETLYLSSQEYHPDISAEIENFCELNDLKFENIHLRPENVN